MAAVASPSSARSARLGLRATPEQEVVLRCAAEVAQKSLADFILDSACLAAEQILLDQRLFMVSGDQYQSLLDRAEQTNASLRSQGTLGQPVSLSLPQPLEPDHQLEGFDCGKTALNDWLLRHARQAQGSGSARIFVVADAGRILLVKKLNSGQVNCVYKSIISE